MSCSTSLVPSLSSACCTVTTLSSCNRTTHGQGGGRYATCTCTHAHTTVRLSFRSGPILSCRTARRQAWTPLEEALLLPDLHTPVTMQCMYFQSSCTSWGPISWPPTDPGGNVPGLSHSSQPPTSHPATSNPTTLTCMSRGRAKKGSTVADSFEPCFCTMDRSSPPKTCEIGDSL